MLSHTLIKYCRIFSKEIDGETIRVFLESSPQYPNLMSVMQTLGYAGLDGHAGQCEWEYLKNLTKPFLLHTKRGNRENLIIAKWDKSRNFLKTYNLRLNKWDAANRNNIVKAHWDGVVIYCNNKQLGDSVISKTQLSIFISLCIIGVLLYALTVSSNIMTLIASAPILFGCIISGYQFFRSHDFRYGLVERLCHIKGADCDKVEESAFSQIYGIKISCIAFSFFLSQLVYAVSGFWFGINSALQSLYFISSLIVIPITAFSVCGQIKADSVCPLCVGVILSLISEASLLFVYGDLNINWNLCFTYCALFTIMLVIMQCVYLINQKESERLDYKISMLQIKRKKETIFINSRDVALNPTPLRFGNDSANVRITAIVSPFCMHCRKVIFQLLTMMRMGADLRLEIILGELSKSDSKVIDSWIKRYLSNKDFFLDELFHWSSDPHKQYFPNYEFSTEEEISRIAVLFRDEIRNLNMDSFPQIIINDRLLSPIYTHDDIEYIIWDRIFENQFARDIG